MSDLMNKLCSSNSSAHRDVLASDPSALLARQEESNICNILDTRRPAFRPRHCNQIILELVNCFRCIGVEHVRQDGAWCNRVDGDAPLTAKLRLTSAVGYMHRLTYLLLPPC